MPLIRISYMRQNCGGEVAVVSFRIDRKFVCMFTYSAQRDIRLPHVKAENTPTKFYRHPSKQGVGCYQ